jgi:hypothetical protein
MTLQKRSDVLQQHEQVERVGRGGLEVVLHVPPFCGVVLGVHKQHARPDRLRRFRAPEEHVLEKRSTEPGALVSLVDCKPREQDRRQRPGACLALERPRRGVLRGDLRGGERVLADD